MTDPTDPTTRLADVLAPALTGLGIVLYDVELVGTGRARTLRVLVDRDGGVDLETVTAATEALAPVLDDDPVVAGLLPGAYLLEVSSPGLERPLRTPAHFQAARGAPVSLKMTTADGARRRERVLLLAADDEAIEVELDGERQRVEYGDIVQARTVFEWGPAPKPGRSKATAGAAGRAAGPKPTVSAPS